MDLEKVKQVRQSDKDLAFGYIREAQKLLPNNDNSYYNIPEIVRFITVLYVYLAEYFELCGDSLKISDDQMTIDYEPDFANSTSIAYGAIRINNQKGFKKYKWKFKVNIINKDVIIHFAIISSHYLSVSKFDRADVYYAFTLVVDAQVGASSSHSKSMRYTESGYKPRIQDGDFVSMELDLDSKTLHFSVNEIRHNQYFNIDMGTNTEYKLAVEIDDPASVTMIDFEAL